MACSSLQIQSSAELAELRAVTTKLDAKLDVLLQSGMTDRSLLLSLVPFGPGLAFNAGAPVSVMEGICNSSLPGLLAPTLNLISPQTVSAQPCYQKVNECKLILRDGTCIVFAEAEVPDPPTTTFADNIPHLNRMWDDTSTYWNRESVLVIHGHPIPIVRWPDIYKQWRWGDWDTIKSNYVDWKVSRLLFVFLSLS
jgi:hypothetical protein